jgi:hypothetical protein
MTYHTVFLFYCLQHSRGPRVWTRNRGHEMKVVTCRQMGCLSRVGAALTANSQLLPSSCSRSRPSKGHLLRWPVLSLWGPGGPPRGGRGGGGGAGVIQLANETSAFEPLFGHLLSQKKCQLLNGFPGTHT